MARRTQNTEAKAQDREITQQSTGSRQVTEPGGGTSRERERELKTDREPGLSGALTRPEYPGWGLTTGTGARSPFLLMRRMMEDMDRMFEDFSLSRGFGRNLGFGSNLLSPISADLRSGISEGAPSLWSPPVEVFEKGDKLLVRAEIPGVSKEDVNVEITDDVITIEGERKQETEDRGEGYFRSERSYGRFVRSIPLPEGVDGNTAEAHFTDGILEITLNTPKREQKRARKLSIT